MDFKVSQKEQRYQPGIGMVDVIVPDVFDVYLVMDSVNPNMIDNVDILENNDELYQSAYFASVKQRGSDPLTPTDGNRWAEVLVGEVSVEVLMTDIKSSVLSVSLNCNVTFDIVTGTDGQQYLSYSIQVVG